MMRPALSTVDRIGFVGDLHGDLGHLLAAARTMRSRGVDVVIVTGDFGFVWPGVNYRRTLDKISKRLLILEITLYFVDGNHEWFPELYSYPIDDDGLRHLRENVVHLPRGYRTVLVSGKVFAALGGAPSIDRDERAEGVNWWPAEALTDADLARLGEESVDVLVGHDAPVGLPSLDQALARNELDLSDEMLAYSLEGRRRFQAGFEAVQPTLYVGGHYHLPIDENIVTPGHRSEFETQVVLLDQAGPSRLNLAVLDVGTLGIDVFPRLKRLTRP